jgi:hypothetical protein
MTTPIPNLQALQALHTALQSQQRGAAPPLPSSGPPGAPPPGMPMPPPGISPGAAAAPRDLAPQGMPAVPPGMAPQGAQPDPMEMQAILKALQMRQMQNAPPAPAATARD